MDNCFCGRCRGDEPEEEPLTQEQITKVLRYYIDGDINLKDVFDLFAQDRDIYDVQMMTNWEQDMLKFKSDFTDPKTNDLFVGIEGNERARVKWILDKWGIDVK